MNGDEEKQNKTEYIACQGDGFIDEIRRMCLAYFVTDPKTGIKSPLIFSGPPGSGKTAAVEFFAKNILGLNEEEFITQIASKSDTIHAYVGTPVISKQGNTAFSSTKLLNAIDKSLDGKVLYYLDETIQLDQDIQKSFSSLMDHRQFIDKNAWVKIEQKLKENSTHRNLILDDEIVDLISARPNKNNFGMFMSYNPSDKPILRLFEDSFLSRAIEYRFEEQPTKLIQSIGTNRPIKNENLQTRGIIIKNDKPLFLEYKENKWVYVDGTKVDKSDIQDIKKYNIYNKNNQIITDFSKISLDEFFDKLYEFDNLVKKTSKTNDSEAFKIVPDSSRTLRYLCNEADSLIENKCPKEMVMNYVIIQAIDNYLRGNLKEKPVNGSNAGNKLYDLAKFTFEGNKTDKKPGYV